MQNSITKPACFADASAKRATSNNVIQELAVSRALSALCGGSGVGQAPEPPQKAALQLNFDKLSFAQGKIRETGEFLPKPPQSLQGSVHIPHIYEIGEKAQVELEAKIGKKMVGVKEAKELKEIKKELKEVKGEDKGRIKVKLEKFKGVIKGKLGEFKGSPRVALRFALQTASYTCIFMAIVGFGFAYGPVIRAEAGYRLKLLTNANKNNTERVKVLPETAVGQSPTPTLEQFTDINFPADTSIVIPKIDAAAEIVSNVDASNYEEYMVALQKGVAHAKGTVIPGMIGNSYLFAHSAGNLFDIARFNAVFYLIAKLEKGDAIYIKFGNEKFKYTVVGKKEVDPTDVKFLTGGTEAIREVGELGEVREDDNFLTLQTCVPPGTDWRRLLVFAKIEK